MTFTLLKVDLRWFMHLEDELEMVFYTWCCVCVFSFRILVGLRELYTWWFYSCFFFHLGFWLCLSLGSRRTWDILEINVVFWSIWTTWWLVWFSWLVWFGKRKLALVFQPSRCPGQHFVQLIWQVNFCAAHWRRNFFERQDAGRAVSDFWKSIC